METTEMSVVDHLHELRKRIIISLITILSITILVYDQVHVLIKLLKMPISRFQIELVFFKLTDGFVSRLQVSLIAAVILTSPITISQILAYLSPGLKKGEKTFLYKNVLIISVLFALGVVFGFVLVLPYSLGFLIAYGSSYLKPALSGINYFNFIGIFCLYTGVVFLFPYVLVLLGKMSLINSKILRKYRKYVIIGAFMIEGVFLPSAGILTFVTAAAPVLIFYEATIWIIYFNERKKGRD
ncbi:twin-arginine translocase subunit TatC [Desulfosporosinus nitroreducens]|uniref:Sec-independent protein translocase protein TatC n=1 Tax=Desulfosporosinus nitroreducens TaxID=2018668 RepID=A0ABT8QRM1_9FIRM|nr:twin-arginine translocase subunit TatC [Desulfosporosinus nitroreducens]MDO0823144.1 twin-arginine translocase subunit TatC [Desulfosporosinus nitroreducens]